MSRLLAPLRPQRHMDASSRAAGHKSNYSPQEVQPLALVSYRAFVRINRYVKHGNKPITQLRMFLIGQQANESRVRAERRLNGDPRLVTGSEAIVVAGTVFCKIREFACADPAASLFADRDMTCAAISSTAVGLRSCDMRRAGSIRSSPLEQPGRELGVNLSIDRLHDSRLGQKRRDPVGISLIQIGAAHKPHLCSALTRSFRAGAG